MAPKNTTKWLEPQLHRVNNAWTKVSSYCTGITNIWKHISDFISKSIFRLTHHFHKKALIQDNDDKIKVCIRLIYADQCSTLAVNSSSFTTVCPEREQFSSIALQIQIDKFGLYLVILWAVKSFHHQVAMQYLFCLKRQGGNKIDA